MLRKTLTIFSLIGLLLSVGLWGVSMKRHLSYIPHSLRFRLSVLGGATWVTWPDESYPLCTDEQLEILLEMGELPGTMEDWSPAMINRMARPGISIYDWDGTQLYFPKIRRIDPQNETIIIIPFWIPTVIVTLALSATRPIHNFRRRKRKKLGLCLKCGYDLRASKDRCPECNTPFDHAKLGQDDLSAWQVRFLGATRRYSGLVVPLLMVFCVLMAFVIGRCLPQPSPPP